MESIARLGAIHPLETPTRRDGEEIEGYGLAEEILLPVDTGSWDAGTTKL